MKSSEYINKAIRTESSLNPLGENTLINHRELHSCIGATTEAGEMLLALTKNNGKIDKVNLMEEIGDLYWYLAILYSAQNKQFNIVKNESLKTINVKDGTLQVVVLTTELLDVCKKALFYGKIKKPMEYYLEQLEVILQDLLYSIGYNLNTTWDINIKKLAARYPDKFSEKKASKRNIKKERKILEN